MISVVIPTVNYNGDLEECIESIKKQNYGEKEIIVVSTEKIELKDKNVRVVRDGLGNIGNAYHVGAKSARGNIVAFIDSDCIAPKDWLQKIESDFDKEDIDVLSGEDLLPANSSFFQKAAYQIDLARKITRPLYGKEAKDRLRAANIAYRKKVFRTENFNPRLKGLQEPEFHHRLFKKGFRMKFDPKVYVYHKRRNSPRKIFSQIYRNGKAKIELLKLHKDMLSLIDVLPFVYLIFSLLMAYYAISLNQWIFFQLWLAATVAYFLVKALFIVAKTGELKYYLHLILIVFVREVAYSFGLFAGLKSIFGR